MFVILLLFTSISFIQNLSIITIITPFIIFKKIKENYLSYSILRYRFITESN